MKLVVFSDLHGDATTAGLDRFDDVSAAVDEIVDAAIRESVDLALFLGDLTDPDTSRSHGAVAMLAAAASRLRREGIAFRAIVGNHDVVEDGRGTSTLSSLKAAGFGVASEPTTEWVHGERAAAGSEALIGAVWLPYPPRTATFDPETFVRADECRALVANRGRVPLLVAGHLMIRSADPGSESVDLARGRDVFFPWEACRETFGRDALLLNGHYHRRQIVAGGIQIPGSAARLRFDEEAHVPGFLICEHPGGQGSWTVRFERVRARPLATIHPTSAVAWREEWTSGARNLVAREGMNGAIVRVKPPADATDERIGQVVDLLRGAGAARVSVERRAAARKIIVAAAPPAEAKRTPREVVMSMADEARTGDREALKAVLDRELTAQKL